jgi:DNA-nicking Smr family endonuclease
MSGGKRGKRFRSGLTPDEQALWDHAAASMTRLAKAKLRLPDGADPATYDADAFQAAMAGVQRRAAAPETSTRTGKASSAHLPGLPTVPEKKPRTPELAAFDRKSAKRLRAGGIEIEARLDLHGMTQDAAHGELRRFLASCHRRGLKWVLVITGKGAPRRSGWGSGEDDSFDAAMFGRQPPGVLRRNVPIWLAAPDLAALVVSHTQAAPNHGGEGAMYVELRRRG